TCEGVLPGCKSMLPRACLRATCRSMSRTAHSLLRFLNGSRRPPEKATARRVGGPSRAVRKKPGLLLLLALQRDRPTRLLRDAVAVPRGHGSDAAELAPLGEDLQRRLRHLHLHLDGLAGGNRSEGLAPDLDDLLLLLGRGRDLRDQNLVCAVHDDAAG